MDRSATDARTLRIAVIGAGPGGLCTAIRLLQEGFEDVVVLDKAPGVGGTWWHNRYPGAACDIQSHLYSYSFELKRDWTRPYATQPEIQRYFEHCVERYALAPHLRLGCEVRRADFRGAAAAGDFLREHDGRPPGASLASGFGHAPHIDAAAGP